MSFIIVDNGDPYSVSSLQHILTERGLPHRTLSCKANFDAIAPDKVSGVFLSGGAPDLDVRDPDIAAKVPLDVACLINCTAPIMGICFGFELIIQLTGGEIVSLPTPVPAKCVEIEILLQEGIFLGLPRIVCMREFNSLGPAKIPHSFLVTAISARSPVEAVQHRSRSIFATLFHPEAADEKGHYQPGGKKIVNNFIDICLAKTSS